MNSREKSKTASALSIWSFMDLYQSFVVVIDWPDGHCITQSTKVKHSQMLSILATSIWLIYCVIQFHVEEIEFESMIHMDTARIKIVIKHARDENAL